LWQAARRFYSGRHLSTRGAQMTELALNYLGEFTVSRDGRQAVLPPSRKTRALLAYLSLNPRRFRRDFLCELLWEIPDDPRGSLRWSLSKLRKLVDDPDRQRVIADRTFVEIDTTGIHIDSEALRTLATGGVGKASLESLEAAAERYRGNFLEGLDLPNFHDFHAWCIAEREQVARDQAAVLRELVDRLADDPERALPHARALVAVLPYDESPRAGLIRILVALDRNDEAEQQYRLGLRMLKEVGVASSGALAAARRRPTRDEADTVRQPSPVALDPIDVGLSSGLVGRDKEATTLARLLDEVRAGNGARFALVRGEPGIGKTRLVEAVTALAGGAGATVLQAGAYESGSIRPFALWTDALHRHDASAAKAVFGEKDAGDRDKLFDRLSEFVAGHAADDTLVLVFDDLHWCDESSAAAIHYVARMNRERRLFGILVSRVADMSDNVAAQQAVGGLRRDGLLTEIVVGPLPQADLAELIHERAPRADAEKLSRQCGGNPLLAIELARAEQAGGGSTSLADLVGERLARLSVDGAEALRWASVLSPHIDVDTVATLADIDAETVGEVLGSAVRQGMLTSAADGVHFSHDLLARAVYSTLSPLRRQVMHRRVAKYLEERAARDLARSADLARHATLSGDPALAARAQVAASRLCLRYYANDEALIHAKRGLQLAEQLPAAERVRLLIELGDVRIAAGPMENWEQAAQEYAALAEEALDLGEIAHARLGYHLSSTLRWAHGQWGPAREESLQSERVIRMGRDEDQVVGIAETAKCLAMIERDLSRADALLMEADAMSSRMGFRYYAIPAAQGMLRFHEGRMAEASELFKDALMLCKSAGSRIDEYQANEYLAMIEFQCGRYEQARTYADVLASIGEKLRVGSEAAFARAVSSLCDLALTDESEALEQALDELREADAKYRLAYTLTRAAQIDCERGRLDIAATRASEALEYATLLQRATEMALARAVLACACQEKGDEDAVNEHKAAIEALEAGGVAAWASDYVAAQENRKKEQSR